ncbi:MAG: ATP-binding protein [Acidimicrobiaceae bacterium]|nr:ATP-binding protein [Acidimicrobiaceae bacterium]
MELERMASAVDEFGEQQDWSPEVVFKVNLVLEELVINVMTHGSHEGLAEIEVTVTSSEDLVSIRLSDNGIAFDPLTDAPDPEVTGSVEDRHVGGLGVHLVRTMMDNVSYQRESGRNLLTMTTQRN